MPLRRNHFEMERNLESNVQVLAPVGLQRISRDIVRNGLVKFNQDKLTKIRVIPVPEFDYGITGAIYNSEKDYLRICVPMNIVQLYYTQKALGDLDNFISQVIPKVRKLSALSLHSVGMEIKSVQKALFRPTTKPEYLPGTQEEYDIQKNHDILNKILDVYCNFISSFDRENEQQLSAEDQSSLVAFVHFIEDFLGNVPDQQVQQALEGIVTLPFLYSLCQMRYETDPRTLEIAHLLIDTLSDSVEHEKIHQIFCSFYEVRQKDIKDKRALRIPSLQVIKSEGRDQIQHDQKQRCLELTLQVMEKNKTFAEVYPELQRINLEVINEVLTRVQPTEARRGYILDFIQVGFQESAIAMVLAQKENEDFLPHIQQYVSKFNCILPPLEALEKMQSIAQKHGDDIESVVRGMATTLYRDEDLYPQVDVILNKLTSLSSTQSD